MNLTTACWDSASTVSARRLTPICVDLDGTLIAADLFWEAALQLILTRPYLLVQFIWWALHGRAYLKRQVAIRTRFCAQTLPYRPEVLAYLERARTLGHPLVLATGSDELFAREIAGHLGLFAETFASDGQVNLTARRKAKALCARFGREGFHYIGNDRSDLHVWSQAAKASVVAAPKTVVRALRSRMEADDIVSSKHSTLRTIFKALRPHQWAKNLLVFVPLIAAHRIDDVPALSASLIAFLAFCLCASSIYIVNDLVDLEADRQHPRKRFRPIAAADLSVPTAVAIAATLMPAALLVAGFGISAAFASILLAYIALTISYSTWFKKEPVVDVFVLAGLYVLRIVAGGVATNIALSSWLLAFGLFLFLSLAFVKRYTELTGNGKTVGRGYTTADTLWMHGIGTSSGYMAVLVLSVYLTAPDVTVLYEHPRLLWLLSPMLLFWITRTWFRAGRNLLHDDPVVEALRDPFSYACLGCSAAVFFLAMSR